MLKDQLKVADLLQSDFARAIGVEAKYPSHFVTGRRPFPLDKLPLAIDVLGLKKTPGKKAEFERLAHLTNAPTEVRDMVARLEREMADLRKDHLQLLKKVGLILTELRHRGVELSKSLIDL